MKKLKKLDKDSVKDDLAHPESATKEKDSENADAHEGNEEKDYTALSREKNERTRSENGQEVKTITLPGKRKKDVNDLKKSIEKLGFREVELHQNSVNVKLVERETMNGAPYLYMNLALEPDKLVVEYNTPKEYSRKLREFEVASLLLRILLVTESYEVDPYKVYKMIFNVFETVHDTLTRDYEKLKSEHDILKEEHTKTKAKFAEVDKVNEKINKTMLEIENRNQHLSERVKSLESVSNETLEEMLIDWLKTNNGAINVTEFSGSHNIAPARTEEGLDLLMKKGIIEKVK